MVMSKGVSIRLLIFLAISCLFWIGWQRLRTIELMVLGQPAAVGLLQRDMEEPFFRSLANTTGLPISVRYLRSDEFGLKDTYQLEAQGDGRLDLVSLRFMQNIHLEASLEGLDIPGATTDIESARQMALAFAPTVDQYLQDRFNTKLLSLWTFGPQIFFCRENIDNINSLKGRRIRVASASQALLLDKIGAIPVILPFDETSSALSLQMVDCAITSAASGHFAGWSDYTKTLYSLPVQFGFNGYTISLSKWNSLSQSEQRTLQSSFDRYAAKLWNFSQELLQTTESCLSGRACPIQESHNLTHVRPSLSDLTILRQASTRYVIPAWQSRCNIIHKDCGHEWRKSVLQIRSTSKLGSHQH